jgi:hypothetical protein
MANSKLEIPARSQAGGRNSKQIQMIKKHKIQNKLVSDCDFWIADLNVSVCFGFRPIRLPLRVVVSQVEPRASDFGF